MLRAALLGRDIGGSLSPALHTAAGRALQGAVEYTLIDAEQADIESAVRELGLLGLHGWNITAPYKEFMARRADRLTPTAERLGAVNTVVIESDGTWLGDNTDVIGFEALLSDWVGDRAVVIGAGGSARAVVHVLARRGVTIEIYNRTTARAAALRDRLAPEATVFDLDELPKKLANVDLAINTTGDAIAPFLQTLQFDLMAPNALFLDLSYGESAHRLLEMVTTFERAGRNGLDMLIAQGLASFALWTGREPDRNFVRDKLIEIIDLQR
jgi:shikimate dehydrogenase